jgi:hypothetical protein
VEVEVDSMEAVDESAEGDMVEVIVDDDDAVPDVKVSSDRCLAPGPEERPGRSMDGIRSDWEMLRGWTDVSLVFLEGDGEERKNGKLGLGALRTWTSCGPIDFCGTKGEQTIYRLGHHGGD